MASSVKDGWAHLACALLPADRYILICAYACPWAHRAMIVRKLKGIDKVEGLLPFYSVDSFLGEQTFLRAARIIDTAERMLTRRLAVSHLATLADGKARRAGRSSLMRSPLALASPAQVSCLVTRTRSASVTFTSRQSP